MGGKTQSPRENTCSQTNISTSSQVATKMKTMKLWSLIGLTCLLVHIIRAEDQADGEDTSIHSCKIESCAGWRLNKLPEVKQFIFEDFEKKYERTTFKRMPGKSPEMIFLNANGEELERVDIAKMTRQELNKFVQAKGISLKSNHDEV